MSRIQIPDDWFERGLPPKPLSETTIANDRWDRQGLADMIEGLAEFAEAKDKLATFVATGDPAMADTYFSSIKQVPRLLPVEEVRPSHLVNRQVSEELAKLPEAKLLRSFSVGDEVSAAMACVALEPDLETLFDRLEQEHKKANEFEQVLMDLAGAQADGETIGASLDELIAKMANGNGDSDEEGDGKPGPISDEERKQLEEMAAKAAEVRKQIEELQEKARACGDELSDALEEASLQIAADLRDALAKAGQVMQGRSETSLAWGLDPGELRKVDPATRLEYAKRLQNPKLRRIAARFGHLKSMRLSEQERRTNYAREEVYDTESGADLARLLPSELLGLTDELFELDFYRRFAQRSLLQYAMRGIEKRARGGIIASLDESGSMSGEREILAKALVLCLMDVAKRERRTMHVIQFSGPGAYVLTSFTKPEDYTFERIVGIAENFYGGGTDFVTPMEVALDILRDEFAANGFTKADVVFVTDDECYVPPDYMEEYLNELKRMDSTTWGVTAHGSKARAGGALDQMAEGKTARVIDFAEGGDELRPMWREV